MARPLFTLIFFAMVSSVALGADVKVTDTSGKSRIVRNVKIDYTQYSVIYTPDFEYNGIRVVDGQARITIDWSKIEKVTALKLDMDNQKLTADIFLKNGGKQSMELVMDSHQGLVGETDLGEYHIDLEKIKIIEPQEPASRPSDDAPAQ